MSDTRRVMRVPWYPPMLVISGAVVLLGAYQLTRQFVNPQAMIPIGAGQSLLAIGLGFYATAGQMFEAVRHLNRLGMRGFSRSRGWFELSRLAWMLLLFLMSMIVAVSLCLWLQPQFAVWSSLWGNLMTAGGVVGVMFFSASTMGYILSLLRWRMPRGRGFECTHFFYVMIVGVSIMGWVVSYYPPVAVWPDGVILVVGGLAGAIFLTVGMISILVQHERREMKTKSAPPELTPHDSFPPLPNPLPRGGGEGT